MTSEFQGTLLDICAETGPRELGPSVQRTELSRGAWIDLRPGWIAGADALFERLLRVVPWRAERRHMYDRVVDVPRLLCFYDEKDALPDPVLEKVRDKLNQHYGAELGEPFRTAGLCLYRDGRDSVAWHGDTIGRGSTEDTMVAIVSLGEPRALQLRPRGGLKAQRGNPGHRGPGSPREAQWPPGRTLRHDIGHGDLLVMGGSCQRTWEHGVPKTARPVGPRISVQFRPRGVR